MDGLFVLIFWFLSVALNTLMAVFFNIVLPVIAVLTRIMFGLLATYPKVFLVLGLLGLAGYLALVNIGNTKSIGSSAVRAPVAVESPEATTRSEPRETADEQASSSTLPSYASSRSVTTDLNLRDGACVNYSVIRVLPRGAAVEILTETEEVDGAVWVKVRIEGREGWVNEKFLK